jgi:zinc transporter 5/7
MYGVADETPAPHGHDHDHAHGACNDHGHAHAAEADHGHSHDGGACSGDHDDHHGHSHDSGGHDAGHAAAAGSPKGPGPEEPHRNLNREGRTRAARGERPVTHERSGIFLHILADTLGSVGVIISSTLIHYFHIYIADAVASIVISVLIVMSVIPLVKASSVRAAAPALRPAGVRGADSAAAATTAVRVLSRRSAFCFKRRPPRVTSNCDCC